MQRDFLITLYNFSIFLVFLSIVRIYSNLQLIIKKLYFNHLVFDPVSSFIVLDHFPNIYFQELLLLLLRIFLINPQKLPLSTKHKDPLQHSQSQQVLLSQNIPQRCHTLIHNCTSQLVSCSEIPKTFMQFSVSRATCSVHFILLVLITLTALRQVYDKYVTSEYLPHRGIGALL